MFDLENFPTRELARDMMGMISPIYDKDASLNYHNIQFKNPYQSHFYNL